MKLRVVSFFVLLLTAFLAPLPLFLFFSLLYIFVWDGYELLVIGALVDSMFGVTTFSFNYTLSVCLLLVLATLVRPYLSWYNTQI